MPQSPFEDTVRSVVWRDAAHKVGPLAAERGVIVVQSEAEHSRIVDLGVLDQDLVGLGVNGGDRKQCNPTGGKVEQTSAKATARQRSAGQDHGTSSISAARGAPR